MTEIFPDKLIETLPEYVKKYLEKFGTTERGILIRKFKKYEAVVVIPALAEFENIPKLISSLAKTDAEFHEHFLVLFVINNSENAENEIAENNRKSFELLKEVIRKGHNEFNLPGKLDFAAINAFEGKNALPQKTAGVGLARKIGLDAALALLDYSSSKQKLLISLDADCEVSRNYFTGIYLQSNKRKLKAGYVNFEHPINIEPYSKAIIDYEIFLRYYVAGLKYAKSPYAFFTIGSTMISDAEAYVKIGGMNKRKAAEDFYFIEKLAKLFDVVEINSAAVFPSPRTSGRVPFGTGRSVYELLSGKRNYGELYSPRIFEALLRWNGLFFNENILTSSEYLERAEKINPRLKDFLIERKFPEHWEKILKKNASEKQILKQKKFLFDGFETLKLIHYLRDNCCENVNISLALPFIYEKLLSKKEIKKNISPKELLFALRETANIK